ncbi:hypothetical protein BDW69DRAFT_181906 [Aspergillus filifer]
MPREEPIVEGEGSQVELAGNVVAWVVVISLSLWVVSRALSDGPFWCCCCRRDRRHARKERRQREKEEALECQMAEVIEPEKDLESGLAASKDDREWIGAYGVASGGITLPKPARVPDDHRFAV